MLVYAIVVAARARNVVIREASKSQASNVLIVSSATDLIDALVVVLERPAAMEHPAKMAWDVIRTKSAKSVDCKQVSHAVLMAGKETI